MRGAELLIKRNVSFINRVSNLDVSIALVASSPFPHLFCVFQIHECKSFSPPLSLFFPSPSVFNGWKIHVSEANRSWLQDFLPIIDSFSFLAYVCVCVYICPSFLIHLSVSARWAQMFEQRQKGLSSSFGWWMIARLPEGRVGGAHGNAQMSKESPPPLPMPLGAALSRPARCSGQSRLSLSLSMFIEYV